MSAIKRLFIEVDPSNEYNAPELRSSLRRCQNLSDNMDKDFWWKIVSEARFEENLFQYIWETDEIYMNTSIMPIISGTSVGSPELWDKMMKLAVENGVIGKNVFNTRLLKDIEWDNIDIKLLKKAFKKNSLFVSSDDHGKWEKVDVSKIK